MEPTSFLGRYSARKVGNSMYWAGVRRRRDAGSRVSGDEGGEASHRAWVYQRRMVRMDGAGAGQSR